MNTPEQNKDELTYFKMFLEFWNDEELIKAVKEESELNTIKKSVLSLKPLFEKTVSDLFDGYFSEGQKEVEKWIDLLKNKEFLPEDEVKEKLKYWRNELLNYRQYNYFLDDPVKSGWVRDNSPANSKDELIKRANSVFYSGVWISHKNHLGDKAEPTLEDHQNLALTFAKDNVYWVFHHAKIITINKYLSGKLSNEPTAKAKPEEKVYTIEDYLNDEGLKRKEKIVACIKAISKPREAHFFLMAANELRFLNFDLKVMDLKNGTIEEFWNVLKALNNKVGTRQNFSVQIKKYFDDLESTTPEQTRAKIKAVKQKLNP